MIIFDEILKILAKIDLSVSDEKIIRDFYNSNINNSEIINKIIHLDNPYLYCLLIRVLQSNFDISDIEEKRINYIKKQINNIKDTGRLSFLTKITIDNYQNNCLFTDSEIKVIKSNLNKLDKVMERISDNWLKENITYYFFRDVFYNYLVNSSEMLLYINSIKEDIISLEHIQLYKEFQKLGEMSFKDKIDFFNHHVNQNNLHEMFYDDMRKVKNHSYHSLVHNLVKLKHDLSTYNQELSQMFGTDVYYFNGEEFYTFVRCILPNKKGEYQKENVESNLSKKYYSFSFISNKNIGTICHTKTNNIILMYSYINPNHIVHVHHTDSSSSFATSQDVYYSNKRNEIHSPNSLIRDTKYYNEIVIKKDNNGIKPSGIICFDNISEEELLFAKQYHLPIVLINREKYYYNDGFPDYSDDDTYVI